MLLLNVDSWRVEINIMRTVKYEYDEYFKLYEYELYEYDIKISMNAYKYIIGHYHPSVRIIDLVSPTTCVVCANFIYKWQDLQFKVDSERQIF